MDVTPTAVDERVDEAVHDRPAVGVELPDPLRRELGIEEAPILGMVGRVDLERDERLVLTDRDRLGPRREHVGVPQRPHGLLVARHVDGGDPLEPDAPRHRAGGTQGGVHLVGCVGVARVEQRGLEVDRVGVGGHHSSSDTAGAAAPHPTPCQQNSQTNSASAKGSARPSTTSWMASSTRANIVRATPPWVGGSRHPGVDGALHLVGQDVDERRERAVQLLGPALGEPAVLADEDTRVPKGTRPGDELERAGDGGPQPSRGIGVLGHLRADEVGAEAAVLLEQGDEEVVLAREVPVEALQVQTGACRDLRDRERRAARLVCQRPSGVDEALETVDRAGPGWTERAGQRPVAPGIGPIDFGERHSPPVWRGRPGGLAAGRRAVLSGGPGACRGPPSG